MAKPAARIATLQVALGLGLLVVMGRAGWLQLVKGREFSKAAVSQRTVSRELLARRGTIFDRGGTPLAHSLPKFQVQIALREVTDTQRLIATAARDLRIKADSLRRSFRRGKPLYPFFGGPFTSGQVEAIRRLRGVHVYTLYGRAYPRDDLARPIVGAVEAGGLRGQSGLERSLDSILAGKPGRRTDLRDPSGKVFESPGRVEREPVAGNDVVLTIDAELQAIAERALALAIKDAKAEGGDVVFMDPRNGELLALASLTESGTAATPSMLTGGFQPGSTAKPFTAAALLALGRVDSAETVDVENGKWTFVTSGTTTRVINDDHPEKGSITLERTIQVSSNIGIAKFSQKLTPEEHYEVLRSFGFGAATGVEFPSEAGGLLPRPDRWRAGYTGPSLAMGYELQITAVQLAAAYGAFANDGVLLAPTLVKEIRAPDGTVLYRHETEVVRRAVSSEIAARIRSFLAEAASDSGTGGRAQVRGGILGKTGTALQIVNGRYEPGQYRASFAGIYPATNPQIVAVVTIDRPHAGQIYGGQVAAPLTAAMLRQALAARESALDRHALADASIEAPNPKQPSKREEAATVTTARLPVTDAPKPAGKPVLIPDVAGSTIRAAAFALHQRGFRVRIEGTGRALRTIPAAGDSLAAGKTVVVYAQ
ncbi:MAG: PASTA domain-containing protein [Gemmatimonadales bacterium]|nr:PASTA domain-containing protein [Gemmatimonadales bacterium]